MVFVEYQQLGLVRPRVARAQQGGPGQHSNQKPFHLLELSFSPESVSARRIQEAMSREPQPVRCQHN